MAFEIDFCKKRISILENLMVAKGFSYEFF